MISPVKFSVNDFSSKSLFSLRKSFTENVIFCAVLKCYKVQSKLTTFHDNKKTTDVYSFVCIVSKYPGASLYLCRLSCLQRLSWGSIFSLSMEITNIAQQRIGRLTFLYCSNFHTNAFTFTDIPLQSDNRESFEN